MRRASLCSAIVVLLVACGADDWDATTDAADETGADGEETDDGEEDDDGDDTAGDADPTTSGGGSDEGDDSGESATDDGETGDPGGVPPVPDPPPEVAARCMPEITYEQRDQSPNGSILIDAFDGEVRDEVATIIMGICGILYTEPEQVPTKTVVGVVVEDAEYVAFADGTRVHVGTDYLADIAGHMTHEELVYELWGMLTHEFTHIYQHSGGWAWEGKQGIVEGMADFVRIRAGGVPLSQRRHGGSWQDGYTTTGFFLYYLDEAYPELPRRMNVAMIPGWGGSFDVRAFMISDTGKDIDTLWSEYQTSF
jgi:hypothetical protein